MYEQYLLTVLLLIYVLNCADGVILGLILQDIKADLQLSDTQLGLLTGIAFALFYSVIGIPIARWADRGNRVAIIAIATALWSVTITLCALAANFQQLLLIRVGVAVGEAACVPAALSLIADHFGRAERPRAVAKYLLGCPLAMVVGYLAGGWVNQFYGWRMTFALLGLPGLGLAALAWFSLEEPRRAKPTNSSFFTRSLSALEAEGARDSEKGEVPPNLKEVTRSLWANTTFRHLLFYFVSMTFVGVGIAQFQPAFLVRSYGLKSGELGTWFAAIFGLGSLLGTYLGGALASRHAANNERLQLRAAATACSILAIPSAFIYLSADRFLAFGLMGIVNLMAAMMSGPIFATLQGLVPQRARATSIALIFFAGNLIGNGLGPLAAGALSDALRPVLGEESLRGALLTLSVGYLWVGWHLWRASKTVARDLASV